MGTTTRFRSEQVDALARELDDIPKFTATEVTVAEAIRRLAPQVAILRSRGYTFVAIAALFTERGVPVTSAALRAILRRASKRARSRGRTHPQRAGNVDRAAVCAAKGTATGQRGDE